MISELEPEDERYSRQLLFPGVGSQGRERLRQSKVLIVGCGALGTHTAESLARAGVGEILLVDRDLVEWSNLERQTGFTEEDATQRNPKALALAEHLRSVNSTVRLGEHAVEFHYRNALDLAAGAHLLIDGTDNVPTRFLLNDVSYYLRTPWIYAGVVQARGLVQAFTGDHGPCLRCTLPDLPPPGTLETCDTAGVLGPVVATVAGWQATLALKILVSGSASEVSGHQVQLQPWDLQAKVSKVLPDRECVVCVGRKFEYLAGTHDQGATVLCGRRAVQVRPTDLSSKPPDFDTLGKRLESLGHVENKGLFLRVATTRFTVTVFPDGRAIFDGLTDEARARSLYARYVGI